MAQVVLNRVLKTFSNDSIAVNNVSLTVADKEFLVLVGPSGCGKSTTLRLIAGLEILTDGEIRIGDRVVNDVAPKDRDIAMVFQNYALYPHMSVYRNMAFGLQLRFGGGVFKRGLMRLFQSARAAELAVMRAGIDNRVRQAAQRLEIEHLLDRKPHELSGGERQRVALGRAIVREPAAFLFDEPLSNLDAKLRQQMRVELKRLHRELDATMIYVTHDQIEAMTLGDRVAVMNQGEIQQVAPPMEIYQRPANLFVARFIGSTPMNLVQGEWVEGSTSGTFCFQSESLRVEMDANRFDLDVSRKQVTLGFRAEAITIKSEAESGGQQWFDATVVAVDQLGDSLVAYVQKDEYSRELWVTRLAAECRVAVGQQLQFELSPDAIHLFDSASGKNLLKD